MIIENHIINNINSEEKTPMLNQDEITALLAPLNDTKYLSKIINPTFGIGSFPAIYKLYTDFADNFEKAVCGLCKELKIGFNGLSVEGLSSYLSQLEQPSLFSTLEIQNLNDRGFINFSPQAVNIFITSMLGGEKGGISFSSKSDYTSIEIRLTDKIAFMVNKLLSDTFKNTIFFRGISVENARRNKEISENIALVAHFDISVHNRVGKLNIALPYKILNAFKTSMDKETEQKHQLGYALDTEVELKAVIKEMMISIKRTAEFAKGDFIPLDIEKDGEISIMNNKTITHKCIMGRKNDTIVLKITKKVKK
jgi:flagellar motor switch protein FliM